MKKTTVKFPLELFQDWRAFYGYGEEHFRKMFSDIGIEITDFKVVDIDSFHDNVQYIECPEINEYYKISSRLVPLTPTENGLEFYLEKVADTSDTTV